MEYAIAFIFHSKLIQFFWFSRSIHCIRQASEHLLKNVKWLHILLRELYFFMFYQMPCGNCCNRSFLQGKRRAFQSEVFRRMTDKWIYVKIAFTKLL